MTTNMDCNDALELVKLRMDEDGIAWNVAYTEYRQLTGQSIASSYTVGNYLKEHQHQKELKQLKEKE